MTAIDPTTLDQLRLEETRLRQGLVSRNTVLGYGYDVQMYSAWCARFRLEALPSTPETLALYLTDLLRQGKKITTARRRKCAIVHEHVSHGLASPLTHEIRELLTGAQRLRGEKPRQMRPITIAQLNKISVALAKIGTPTALRNRALLVLGFASALRRSNLAALNLADIEFSREGLIVSVSREKNDQKGVGRSVGLPRGKHANTCPVRVLRDWLRVRGRHAGPLFPRLDPTHEGEPLDGEFVCRIVKDALVLIDVDPTQYGAHSLRAGFITAAGEAGVGELLIASQSGHRNMQTLRRYFRRTDLFRANACAMVGL